ncbi:MAG: ABC transporter substrate-binding protein [Methanophagales archaeon]|nr:ABC transporter substrate-binding protein [Methanophagales archaeon]
MIDTELKLSTRRGRIRGRRKAEGVFCCIASILILTSVLATATATATTSATTASNPNTATASVSVSRVEVIDAVMAYMRATYLGEETKHLEKEELGKLACIYFFHGRYPRTITTATGENVTIYKPLRRLVVLNTDIAEAIRVLGARGRIVGISDTIAKRSDYFPVISKKPVVGTWKEIDPEAVLRLEPDAVFAYGRWPGPEYIEDKLPSTITVIRLDFFKPEELREGMKTLGYLLEEEANASKYLNWHDKYVREIEDKVSAIPEDEKPVVFLDKSNVDSISERKTYSKGTAMHQLCELAGGRNIAVIAELEGSYPAIETEKILEQNPDVIVGLSRKGGYRIDDESGLEEEYKRIVELPGFNNIRAVADERVYLIDGSIAFGSAYPVGLAYMAKWLHPDLLKDLDPQAIHQEYIDKFCGMDFNVRRHGVFVYPVSTS